MGTVLDDLYPIAQKPAERMLSDGLKMKKLISAGVLALADMTLDNRLKYLRLASPPAAGEKKVQELSAAIETIKNANLDELNGDSADLFARLKDILGPNHGMDNIIIRPARGRPHKHKIIDCQSPDQPTETNGQVPQNS